MLPMNGEHEVVVETKNLIMKTSEVKEVEGTSGEFGVQLGVSNFSVGESKVKMCYIKTVELSIEILLD